MKNKLLIFTGIFVFIFLLIGSFFISFKNKATGNQLDFDVEKIPEDCRPLKYESNLSSWKQHLSHHKQTQYCLKYYDLSEDKLNKNNEN